VSPDCVICMANGGDQTGKDKGNVIYRQDAHGHEVQRVHIAALLNATAYGPYLAQR